MDERKVRRTKKSVIDGRVALLTDTDLEQTSAITTEFLNQIKHHLLEGGEVFLPGFGFFRIIVRRGKRAHRTVLTKGTFQPGETAGALVVAVKKKYYVCFKKAKTFTEEIRERFGKAKVLESTREEAMMKYGVDETGSEQEKLAADGCPECGRKPERYGNVLVCPIHGSEPFEKKTKE